MRTQTKIWIGVGAFIVAGTATAVSGSLPADQRVTLRQAGAANPLDTTSIPRQPASGFVVAQHARHGGEGGEGEGGEGEGGERGAAAKLPPDLSFALSVSQIRGHLLIGDQLVKEGQWSAAMPHFLHPAEEIYGDIRQQLKTYNTPPFEVALKNLSNLVKRKTGGEAYDKALGAVQDALAAADAGLKAKQANWAGFTVETALELVKTASDEYEEAIKRGRIANPVEYQDARGFVLEAERMIEKEKSSLEGKDAQAYKHIRDAFADLKTIFPTAMPPKTPVKDYGAMLGDVSRIELAAGRLM